MLRIALLGLGTMGYGMAQRLLDAALPSTFGTAPRHRQASNTWLAFEIEAAAEVGALAARLGVPHDSLKAAVTGGPWPPEWH